MTFGPDIPAVEHEAFAKPPLKAMLGQIRFPTVLKIADLGALGGLQEAIRDTWPEFAQEQQLSVVVGPGGPQQAEATRAFRFTAPEGTWSALLTPDSLTLEAVAADEHYTSYREFGERFSQIWGAVLEHFRPRAVLQQGLRYVNHIERELAVGDWQLLINPELLGPLTTSFSTGLVQAMADLRFELDDGLLAFKHGLVPAGPQNKLGYLLDFDYFTQVQNNDTSVEALLKRFDCYHDKIYAFFRWCVTEQALEEFRNGD
jgi:uncharacterized protein (TIGR04255 family)